MVRQSDRAIDDQKRPVLFPGTAICADCGELYTKRGLVSRCKDRHEVQR